MNVAKPEDVSSPRRRVELRWGHAISSWQDGDAEPLKSLLLGRAGVPRFAREFLADVVLEKPRMRRQGRPPARTPEQERDIWRDVMQRMDNGATREVAIATAGESEAVRGIVTRLERLGLTRELWLQKMRPR